MKRRSLLRCVTLCCVGVAIACTTTSGDPIDLPPLKLAITDVKGAPLLQTDYDEFRHAIAAALDTDVQFFPVENSAAATVGLQRGEIDLALAGPSEYVVINTRTNAVPVLAVTRPDYYSVIVVRADSGMTRLADLEGAAIALSDVGSTSGHLGPTALLIEAGLDPKTDVTLHLRGDEGSVAAMQSGEVDAWGGSATDYADMLQDTAGTFTVLIEGPPLPSDVLIASSSLDPALIEVIRQRLLSQQVAVATAIATHQTKYIGSTLTPASDADYDAIRDVYRTIGQGEFVQ